MVVSSDSPASAEVSRTQWVSIAGNVTVTLLTAFAIALTAVQFRFIERKVHY